jgi:hypothetical protein
MKVTAPIIASPAKVRAMVETRLSDTTLATAQFEITGGEKEGQCPWLWVRFPAKPAQEDLQKLKDLQFRYGGKRKAWFHFCETPAEKRSYHRWYSKKKYKTYSSPKKKEEEKKDQPTATFKNPL